MAIIRSVRGGSARLNEEDRLELAKLLVKAGYQVRIGRRVFPSANGRESKEYYVEYTEGSAES